MFILLGYKHLNMLRDVIDSITVVAAIKTQAYIISCILYARYYNFLCHINSYYYRKSYKYPYDYEKKISINIDCSKIIFYQVRNISITVNVVSVNLCASIIKLRFYSFLFFIMALQPYNFEPTVNDLGRDVQP